MKDVKKSGIDQNNDGAREYIENMISGVASAYGVKINMKRYDSVVNGLVRNVERYGMPHCPCQVVGPDTVCPCRNMQIGRKCTCNLFIDGDE